VLPAERGSCLRLLLSASVPDCSGVPRLQP
jgi:hypothetical protein